MTTKELLVQRLISYQQSDAYPFHMPGHKRQVGFGALGSFSNPYSIDITEIDGFDNLHHPEGILKESMEWAASVYHTEKTYYLVNGSSCGLLAAISAVTTPGGSILIGRNCHKAAYHGVFLNQLKSYYVYPQNTGEFHIQGGLAAVDIKKMLTEHPDIQAVVMVSPTYDGVVSDVEAIAEVVHEAGLPLIVDEAHGAHFPFGEKQGYFPKSALSCGADLVIQSVHKTLPSLTQTAVLHLNSKRVEASLLEFYLQIYQTSSPSYLFMASIEQSIFYMNGEGRENLKGYIELLSRTRQELTGMRTLQLMDQSNLDVFDYDCSKIVVSTKNIPSVSGADLSELLRKRYQLEIEMSGADYVVAISTLMDTKEGMHRLSKAFLEIENQWSGKAEEAGQSMTFDMEISKAVMKISEAIRSDQEKLNLEQCEGRISAEFVYVYPPGIPIVVPGEVFSETILHQIQNYKTMGYPVQGMADERADNILCVKSIM